MNESSSASLGRRAMALVILLIAAWVLLHFLIHIAVAVASIVVFVVAVFAVIWALRVVF
jgi:hypothetical protein